MFLILKVRYLYEIKPKIFSCSFAVSRNDSSAFHLQKKASAGLFVVAVAQYSQRVQENEKRKRGKIVEDESTKPPEI